MTPAAVDRDFNFLVGIERHLDRAERDVEDRGILISDQAHGGVQYGPQQSQRTESNLTIALRNSRVLIERAPKGMQRQLQNRTRWMKKGRSAEADEKRSRQKCLNWTIEWIDDACDRTLGACCDTVDLQTAYARATNHGSNPAKRRKLSSGKEDIRRVPERRSSASQSTLEEVGKSSPQSRHFYLLRPLTSTSSRVLIPMSPTSSIADCLRERVVLEFPTFYVLPYPSDALPSGCVTETQYLGPTNRERENQERDVGETSAFESETGTDTDNSNDTDSTEEDEEERRRRRRSWGCGEK
ncbi:MAG: hypothetical protein M1816_005411 [Peltula sp. TS41687]|nr:MAG: hypothetical protein M1816_005411 [Peltula sp. TS41687]